MTHGVPTGPRPPDSHESIEAYLAANDGRFTAAALRTELIRAGHAPERIDAALRRIALGGPGGTPTTRLPPPATGRLIFGDASGSVRRRTAVWLLRLAHVAVFLGVAWWYATTMSGVGAIIAGILLSFGVGFGFFAAMTAFGESSRKLERGNVVSGIAAGVAAPVMVLLVLTGICVAVSRPIDWLTGGL